MTSVRLIAVTPDAEKTMAYIARVSSPNQDNENIQGLLSYCIRHGHWSVFEHAFVTLEVETSRAIARQLLRHRSFSFSEFCLSGETLITTIAEGGRSKKIPIKKLYAYQSDPRMDVIWDRGVRVFDDSSKTFFRSTIREVFKTGEKTTYTVTLEDGKQIRTTMEHKFLTKNGFHPLEGLKVGDLVAVNGETVYQSKEWMQFAKQQAISEGTGVQGIANQAGCSYHTVRKWLREHQIQFTKQEVAQYKAVWNKGLPAEQQPRFGKIHSDVIRAKMRESSRQGDESEFYLDNRSAKVSERLKIFQWQNKYRRRLEIEQKKCAACESETKLQIDHVLPVSTHPELAYEYTNLQLLCVPCHRVKSTRETANAVKTVRWKQIVSIEFYGSEDTYDLEVEHSSHNYVANGLVVHNSQRYAEVTDDFIVVEARRQDTKNRQSSHDDLASDVKNDWDVAQTLVWETASTHYKQALANGVAKECARALLPEGLTPSRLYMSGSVRSWIHYVQVRCDESTQKEHRDVALLCARELSKALPIVFKQASAKGNNV